MYYTCLLHIQEHHRDVYVFDGLPSTLCAYFCKEWATYANLSNIQGNAITTKFSKKKKRTGNCNKYWII